ncbi:hypothetical protein [Geothrix sp. 21YS21S-4]|uniref:hypothetical protein n=1 Tax=Geothrix sp. 21YS21S-4 TaxID=3068889 RepID=UPI0027BA6F19|nr:hypothetical protein [Geothrix sp. 21YS21S-4]
MSAQSLIAASAAGLAALYFLRGAFRGLRGGGKEGQGKACGTCDSAGTCPAARKER